MALPIDVGAGAANYDTYNSAGQTFIDLTNPANLSGFITSIDVWATADITGLRVGIFFLVSGTTYQCRSSAIIGSVASGSKKTFSAVLSVQAGDFIGCYFDAGRIEKNTSGGSGNMYVSGEYIDPSDSASYTLEASVKMGLYGQGVISLRGWCSK